MPGLTGSVGLILSEDGVGHLRGAGLAPTLAKIINLAAIGIRKT